MKLKRGLDADTISIDEEGELVYEIGKPKGYYNFTIIIGVITFFVGFIIGGIFINSIYSHYDDPAVKNIVNGCISSYDYASSNPARIDIFSSFYRTSVVADSIIDCLNRSKVYAYNISNNNVLSQQSLMISFVGCEGDEVSNSWFGNESQFNEFYGCLNSSNIGFKLQPSAILITITPYSPVALSTPENAKP